MIRTILSLALYGLLMMFLGIWIAIHPADFSTWLAGRSEWFGHVVQRHECKVPAGWYSCSELAPVSPTPTPHS